jgi:hypothetical protein
VSTGNKPLAESVRQDIVERTDGIPLFVEEMTKAVLEAESEGDARKTAAAVPSSTIAVPASLHASLMARLDRLGSAKEMAQSRARRWSLRGAPQFIQASYKTHAVDQCEPFHSSPCRRRPGRSVKTTK